MRYRAPPKFPHIPMEPKVSVLHILCTHQVSDQLNISSACIQYVIFLHISLFIVFCIYLFFIFLIFSLFGYSKIC